MPGKRITDILARCVLIMIRANGMLAEVHRYDLGAGALSHVGQRGDL